MLCRGILVCLVVIIGNQLSRRAPGDDESEVPSPNAAAGAFFKEYAGGEWSKIGKYFAPKVSIYGDSRFLGITEPQPRDKVIAFTRKNLVAAYGRFFESIGLKKWDSAMAKLKPTLIKAEVADIPFKGVQAGDFVYDLHFREAHKGEARGLDEAVIFVFRKLDQEFLIVAHYADF